MKLLAVIAAYWTGYVTGRKHGTARAIYIIGQAYREMLRKHTINLPD